MNLSGPILRYAKPVTVNRPPPSILAQGRVVTNPPTPVTVRGVMVPFSPRELMMLPEGERTKDYWHLFTPDRVQTVDVQAGTGADVVQWKGRNYKVTRVNDWNDQGGFYDAVCMKVGQ